MKYPYGDDMFVRARFGSFHYRAVDLVIPSRGMDIVISRFFNSDHVYDPPYDGWYFNFDERLIIQKKWGEDTFVFVKFPNGDMLAFRKGHGYDPTTPDNKLILSKYTDNDDVYYTLGRVFKVSPRSEYRL